MRPVTTFTIVPSLPERIGRLIDLANNLWWTWEHEAIDLIRRIDQDMWDTLQVCHNPVKLLARVSQARLLELTEDEGFLTQYDRVIRWLDSYMEADAKGTTWFKRTFPDARDAVIAYFSAEFGLNECVPNYSGGLGVLAGDYTKSATDLGLPFVGVGLLYQQGYFRQYLNNDGWQQEEYPVNDFYSMPLELMLGADGTPVKIGVSYPGRTVYAQIWKVQVGRVPLYLLDTNIPDNPSLADRDITDQLYGGDRETRIKQEVMLGIGGIRALAALGITPSVCHMNEGHSSFMAVERIRLVMEREKCSFDEAKEIVRSGTVFTTHTPVPAGNDTFSPDMIDRYLYPYYEALGIGRERFLALGQEDPGQPNAQFGMTVLAINLASYTNAVSKLHGRVAREMWKRLWPKVPVDEVPISSITNGVHVRSWISNDMAWLYSRYLSPRWMERPADHTIWEKVSRIPDEELWRTHERRRERLVSFARRRLEHQLRRRGATKREIIAAAEVLDPEALTISFARRFATYKRSTLLLRDPDRLMRLLSDKKRPVQLIFAGKAHPADAPGKELIRAIIHFIRRSDEMRRRIVFIEDYDINVARYLVQGSDVWLNTPRRPLEASGTSGMKAAINGALNVSILDGWWDEAFAEHGDKDIGWAIGRGEEYTEHEIEYQDDVESRALFDLLEKEVVPLFYERDASNLPRGWIARMKASMVNLCPTYNTNRMVQEYTRRFYLPAGNRWKAFQADGRARAAALVKWKERIRKDWSQVRLLKAESDSVRQLPVGQHLTVNADVFLGTLTPDDVAVEVYYGRIDPNGEIVDGMSLPMDYTGEGSQKGYRYTGSIEGTGTGQHGFTIRVLPHHPDLINSYETGLISWSS